METETFDLSVTDEEFQLIRSAVAAKRCEWERMAKEETDVNRTRYFAQMKNQYADLSARLGMLDLERYRQRREEGARDA